jgi:hypothetical protein
MSGAVFSHIASSDSMNETLYISVGIKEHAAALKKLGKYKTGVGCLYINKLEETLRQPFLFYHHH